MGNIVFLILFIMVITYIVKMIKHWKSKRLRHTYRHKFFQSLIVFVICAFVYDAFYDVDGSNDSSNKHPRTSKQQRVNSHNSQSSDSSVHNDSSSKRNEKDRYAESSIESSKAESTKENKEKEAKAKKERQTQEEKKKQKQERQKKSEQAKHKKEQQSDSTSNLAQLNYQSGQSPVKNINNNKSTLNPDDWKSNHVQYSDLDDLNRTSQGNTAYLEGRNVADDSLRVSQRFQPTGYHQKYVGREPIINRGHEIAYSVSKGISVNGQYEPGVQSGDQNNPKNLFSQTAFSNQRVQTIYESKVRDALRDGEKVIYQVTPIFSGNDLMAKGVHMQAVSTNGSLNYNVYIYNVQPGMKFDYSTGYSSVDHQMNVPTPDGAPTFYDHESYNHNSYGNNYRNHHYVRDAAILGAAHHVVRHHYQRKYARRYNGCLHYSYNHTGRRSYSFHHRW